MLPRLLCPHQHGMSDSSAAISAALRFSRLLASIVALPGDAQGQRKDIRALGKQLKSAAVVLSADADGVLLVDGKALAPEAESSDEDRAALALLASRLAAYGVESLTLAQGAADADLHELARLLATPPEQTDPWAFFAARAAAIDARSVPRSLRRREEPAKEEHYAPPIKELPTAGSKRKPAAEPEPSPSAAAPVDDYVAPVTRPETDDAQLRALLDTIESAEDIDALHEPLEDLATRADLAFRTGKTQRMLEAMVGLVAVEYTQLERDPSDARRQAFTRAVRRLARPVILRQLAGLRHTQVADATIVERVQALLARHGTDGADALVDEWISAPTPEARMSLLEALRTHRRTHDALFEQVRSTDDLLVRNCASILGALGGARSEQMLLELLRHPDVEVRRSVVAALAAFPSDEALDALGIALLDDEIRVRLQAVEALAKRGPTAVRLLTPAIVAEEENEVLYAAMFALGRIGSPDAVQLLIQCAQGEGQHPRRRAASYRLQACTVLVLVRTPPAMAAVQSLRNDRDRDVRQGSQRIVQQAVRRSTGTMRAVTAP